MDDFDFVEVVLSEEERDRLAGEYSLEVLRATVGCPCLRGAPAYLQVFPEELRREVFYECGPHPSLDRFRSVYLRHVGQDLPFEWRIALARNGVALFFDAEKDLSLSMDYVIFGDIGVLPVLSPAMQRRVTLYHAASCDVSVKKMMMPTDPGYCYLSLYPEERWYDLAKRLGPWPTLSALPSGRFPAVAKRVVADFLRTYSDLGLVHCAPAAGRDELAQLPQSVRVGGLSYASESDDSLPDLVDSSGVVLTQDCHADEPDILVLGDFRFRFPDHQWDMAAQFVAGSVRPTIRSASGVPYLTWTCGRERWWSAEVPAGVGFKGAGLSLLPSRTLRVFGKGPIRLSPLGGMRSLVVEPTDVATVRDALARVGSDLTGFDARLCRLVGPDLVYHSPVSGVTVGRTLRPRVNVDQLDDDSLLETVDPKYPGKYTLSPYPRGYFVTAVDTKLAVGGIVVGKGLSTYLPMRECSSPVMVDFVADIDPGATADDQSQAVADYLRMSAGPEALVSLGPVRQCKVGEISYVVEDSLLDSDLASSDEESWP